MVSKLLFLIFFFPVCLHAQTFTSSNLPIVVIHTNGLTIRDDPKIIANMGIIWNGPGVRNSLNDPKNNYNGNVGIEFRGSSSQDIFPKKSYGFETKSMEGENIDVSLLGLPEENDWILNGPYSDKTMIRNVLTFTLDASLGHYSSRCRHVELVLNGKYEGVYVLMEKIKRNKNRVDIAKLLPTDISGEELTGGYIIKIDKTTGSGGDGWTSDYYNTVGRTFYQYEYPKDDEIVFAQKSYIQGYVRNMERSLYQDRFSGTGSYHEFLNDSSFIDFMIVNELSKNIDGYRLSSYLYKEKNERLNCGPIWDFNLAYGNADYDNGWNPIGFQYVSIVNYGSANNPFWWSRLMRDPSYVQKLKKRWSWIRKHELSDQRINFVTDSLVNLLSEAQVRNYQRWTGVIGYKIWPNYYVGSSYASEVTWMKNWLAQRLAYLDQQWNVDLTGSEDLLASNARSIYPNPFTERLNIQLAPSINGMAWAELFSTGGTLIRKQGINIENGQTELKFLENNSLNTGMYVLRISQNKSILLTEKIVKGH